MQATAEPDAEGDRHGRCSADGPTELKQSPAEQGLQGTDHQADPGGESGDAMEPWRRPGPGRQHAVKDPGSRQI